MAAKHINLPITTQAGTCTVTVGAGAASEAALTQLCEKLGINLSARGSALAIADESFINATPSVAGTFENLGIPIITLPGGETSKSFAQLQRLCGECANHGLHRGSTLFSIGGGVVGDVVGFTAAAYQRGIRLVQIPTTLLAMVDSSVGGKTGINLPQGKNLVGAFHQPVHVAADTNFLTTLPPQEFSAGMAEIIKAGLIAQAALYTQLQTVPAFSPSSEATELAQLIARAVTIKANVVQADEREGSTSGGRALLNLGHTFGHALESVAGYGTYLHGEAVGIGMLLALQLSHQTGIFEEGQANAFKTAHAGLTQLLESYHLPTRLRAPLPANNLVSTMHADKKAAAGSIKFVLLESIGKAVTHQGNNEQNNPTNDANLAALWQGVGAV